MATYRRRHRRKTTTTIRTPLVVIAALFVTLVGLVGLRQSRPNGCFVTLTYPNYIPLAPSPGTKYGLYLYREGPQTLSRNTTTATTTTIIDDYRQHFGALSGVPVLFIPGHGGSHRQVRFLAAESDRAFHGGLMEERFYRVASAVEEAGESTRVNKVNNGRAIQQNLTADVKVEEKYPNHLDWFTVDLDSEHSAMDGRILERHIEYVVQAIHKVLDVYKESIANRSTERSGFEGTLPTSVILVGHSMGGFIACAAVVHSGLRIGTVQTVLTLSSPHLSPPLAMQPSLGYLFSRVNNAWREGYELTNQFGRRRWKSSSARNLSNVVAVSLVGGTYDYQIRSKIASLDGIVPPTNGLTIAVPEVLNVWSTMDHHSLLWCHQLVIQVSHTLLQIIDRKSGQSFDNSKRRISAFVANLRTAIPQNFGWINSQPHKSIAENLPSETGSEEFSNPFSCPQSTWWSDERHEKSLHIETSTVAILAMDGGRRWLDIKKLGSDGKDHFVLVTNLEPCIGVRVHLWPEKNTLKNEKPVTQKVLEVTTMMLQLPAGPTPWQMEHDGQTEQSAPLGFLRLTPNELDGFRFITISVAHGSNLSGGLHPTASMVMGQFFKRTDALAVISPLRFLSLLYNKKEFYLEENHTIIANFSVSVSIGVLPLSMELKTMSCGQQDSMLGNQKNGDIAQTRLCKLCCFPPVVLVWDPMSGLSVLPNFYSDRIELDSSPALWGAQRASSGATILIMADPRCAYKIRMGVSFSAAATRFLLNHGLEIAGFAAAIVLFLLMQQVRAWELDRPVPSVMACLDQNLASLTFLSLNATSLAIYSLLGFLQAQTPGSFPTFILVSIFSYLFANGAVLLLAIGTRIIFHAAASSPQSFPNIRGKAWIGRFLSKFSIGFLSAFSWIPAFQIIHIVRSRPALSTIIVTMMLVSFCHPTLGLLALLLVHAWGCYSSLYSHVQQRGSSRGGFNEAGEVQTEGNLVINSEAVISFGDTHLEIFNYRQGLLLLHLIATAMFTPSLLARGQKIGMDLSFSWVLDGSLCFGIILHGSLASKMDVNMAIFPLRYLWTSSSPVDYGMSSVYFLAGIYCYLCALDLAPYRTYYAFAVIGLITAMIRGLQGRAGIMDGFLTKHHHFHRH